MGWIRSGIMGRRRVSVGVVFVCTMGRGIVGVVFKSSGSGYGDAGTG